MHPRPRRLRAGSARPDPHRRLVDRLSLHHQGRREFGRAGKFKTPMVESTGTGGGIKLFCAGVGAAASPTSPTPRAGSSPRELEDCSPNGVKEIVEVKIGYDGIVFANSKQAPRLRADAQADLPGAGEERGRPPWASFEPNPTKTWKDVDKSLPATKIEVLGPPPTSGTRDAFVELVMEAGCKAMFPGSPSLEKDDDAKYVKTVRLDARGRRLRRSRRERQPDRAEARGQPRRGRHLRLQLPRGEPRQAPGLHRRRRRAHLRQHRRRSSTRSRGRCSSTSRRRTSASSPASRSSSPSSPATRRSARRATSPTTA